MSTQTWRPKRRPSRLLNGIDFWAFLSVEITLLMIFMTDARPLHTYVPVDYAHSHNATPEPGARREDALNVAVTRDGNIFFGTHQVQIEELKGKIQAGMQNGAEEKVYIKADARARFVDVVRVVDALRDVKVQNIAFITDQRQP